MAPSRLQVFPVALIAVLVFGCPPSFSKPQQILSGEHPSPHVLRTGSGSALTYYLTDGSNPNGDIPIYQSANLGSWQLVSHAFGRGASSLGGIDINGYRYCNIWAAELNNTASGFLLTFTADRFRSSASIYSTQDARYLNISEECPDFDVTNPRMGVYQAWSNIATGPYAPPDQNWTPMPAGAYNCPPQTPLSMLPSSPETAQGGCLSSDGFCTKTIRLDSTLFQDPNDQQSWIAYSWYTKLGNAAIPWERQNYYEHVAIVGLKADDPFSVKCDASPPPIFAANPHDQSTLGRLASSCAGCSQMLRNTRGASGGEMLWPLSSGEQISVGVAEAPSLMRRGGYVYLFVAGSAFDSPYYHVYWIAAPSVEELDVSNPNRLVGRFLIPGDGHNAGHGSPVVGPDGLWYFVHDHMNTVACQQQGQCQRDAWITPIRFEDHGDGRGAVYIKPVFLADVF